MTEQIQPCTKFPLELPHHPTGAANRLDLRPNSQGLHHNLKFLSDHFMRYATKGNPIVVLLISSFQ
jgi:hypothetical protein